MIRLAYTLVVAWFLALSFAPLTLLAKTNPTLVHQQAPACYKPAHPLLSKAAPVKQQANKQPAARSYSAKRLAYVNEWTDNEQRSAKILRAVHKVSKETGLPSALLLAVIQPESGFDPKANSGRGDYGLMQVRAKHHKQRMRDLKVKNIYDVEQNIRLGADIIVDYRNSAKGNLKKALVRYTGGSVASANKILRIMKTIPS